MKNFWHGCRPENAPHRNLAAAAPEALPIVPAAPAELYFTITLSKNAVGAALAGGEFTFGLYDESAVLIATATNDARGIINFTLHFTNPSRRNYSVREISAPPGWLVDATTYPILIEAYNSGQAGLSAVATYPSGLPGFLNIRESAQPFGLIRFPPLTFNAPGIYPYTIRELTPSGDGWTTDDRVYLVTVTVEDDGSGNLVATLSYPSLSSSLSSPSPLAFTPAQIIISASKEALNAPLPSGRFLFGLFDATDALVATAVNDGA